jgi:uracil-DNA glycosylase
MAKDDLRHELRVLVAGFHAHLDARARAGAIGVSCAASPRSVPVAHAAPFAADSLRLLREELGDCQRCRLCQGRKNIVFGVGNPQADLVFVGEAPGGDEDQQGEPFVGAAGQLLTKMIAAMGYRREDVYICNLIKCRPPNNRDPEPDEVAACEPFLKKQLAAIQPRVIVALGRFAAQSLCREQTAISRLRGTFRSYEGIPVMPTYHPAFLLRTPEAKREAWSDLRAVMAALREMGAEIPGSSS